MIPNIARSVRFSLLIFRFRFQGRKIKEFSDKAMPIMNNACKVVGDLSRINDQYQGRGFQQFPTNYPNQFIPPYSQFNFQYPQGNNRFPQYNPQTPQFTPLFPQYNPQNNPLVPASPLFPTFQNPQPSAQNPDVSMQVPKDTPVAPMFPTAKPILTDSPIPELNPSTADSQRNLTQPKDNSIPEIEFRERV